MKEKKCSKCGKLKSIENDFQFSRSGVKRANCKECQKEYDKEYRKKNPDVTSRSNEKRKPKLKIYRKKNKEKRNEYLRDWYKKNPKKRHGQKLRQRYGIDVDKYESMLKDQGGVCAICGGSDIGRKGSKNFPVDHCHKTGKIRGLLCHKCNAILGLCDDNIKTLKSAIQYLKLNQLKL